jgi:hypothetical protein
MKIIFVGIALSLLLVFSNIHVSESYLQYNLLVTVKPEKTPINDTDFPVIAGTVMDEVSKPVEGALVKITFAKEVVTTTTDQYGNFSYQSVLSILPGDYMINVVVTKDGYSTGLASSTLMVNSPPTTVTYDRSYTGDPIVTGNYTVYIGKVTDWNLETTCFVDFGAQYKRFLKTCDLYNLAPADFQTDATIVHSLAVIQYNEDYRLFPVSDYFNVAALNDTTQFRYVENVWGNYTVPN